jgi:hypothetical protein
MASGSSSTVTTYLMVDGLVSDHRLPETGHNAGNHSTTFTDWYRTKSHAYSHRLPGFLLPYRLEDEEQDLRMSSQKIL